MVLKYFFMARRDFLTDILNSKIEYILSDETYNDTLKVPWDTLSIAHFFIFILALAFITIFIFRYIIGFVPQDYPWIFLFVFMCVFIIEWET